MPRKQSVSSLKKHADRYFSLYIRTRDADEDGLVPCITCGIKKPIKEMQNGHFISRRVNILRYDEQNCNGQCIKCNMYGQGEQYLYSLALDEKYGKGTAESLVQRKNEYHKFTKYELTDIINRSKRGIKT